MCPHSRATPSSQAVNDVAQTSKSLRELAAGAQSRMEQSNGVGWHVAVGSDFAVDLRYVRVVLSRSASLKLLLTVTHWRCLYGLVAVLQRKGACILLSSRSADTKVLLYRTTPALSAVPKTDHEVLLEEVVKGEKTKLKQRVVVNEGDMSVEMRTRVQESAKRLLEHFVGDADMESQVAKALKVRSYCSLTRRFQRGARTCSSRLTTSGASPLSCSLALVDFPVWSHVARHRLEQARVLLSAARSPEHTR